MSNIKLQIPSDPKFYSNSEIDDKFFIFLQHAAQTNFQINHSPNRIYKRFTNFSYLAEKAEMSRRTFYRRLETFSQLGLISITQDFIDILPIENFVLFPESYYNTLYSQKIPFYSNFFKMYAIITEACKKNTIFYDTQNHILDSVLGENSRSASAQRIYKENMQALLSLGVILCEEKQDTITIRNKKVYYLNPSALNA